MSSAFGMVTGFTGKTLAFAMTKVELMCPWELTDLR